MIFRIFTSYQSLITGNKISQHLSDPREYYDAYIIENKKQILFAINFIQILLISVYKLFSLVRKIK